MPPIPKPRATKRQFQPIDLPPPRTSGRFSLERALNVRRSARDYLREPISLSDLAQLLWSCQGITSSDGLRTTPSAGAVYPLEIYAAVERVEELAAGVYHYVPGLKVHRMELVKSGKFGKRLFDLTTQQDFIAEVAVNVVIATVTPRMREKYGDAAERLVLLEMGHAAQNIHLQAESLGLGSVAVGYLKEKAIMGMFGIEAEPLYMVSVGKKKF